jgi:hypothetical protein
MASARQAIAWKAERWGEPLAVITRSTVMPWRHEPHSPPSLILPDGRSWFIGIPIYTNEIAVAGTTAVIDAVVADRRLNARRATPDDVIDIDDRTRPAREETAPEKRARRVALDA